MSSQPQQPRNPLASAEPSQRRQRRKSGAETRAAQNLPRLQTQVTQDTQATHRPEDRRRAVTIPPPPPPPPPPTVSSVETVPLPSLSAPDSPQSSLPYGPSGSGSPTNPVFSAPAFHREPPSSNPRPSGLPSHTAKRQASLTELRSQDHQRKSLSAQQPFDISSSPTRAHNTYIPPREAQKNISSRPQAPENTYTGTITPNTRDAQAGKRPPGRPRKPTALPPYLAVATESGTHIDGDRLFHKVFAPSSPSSGHRGHTGTSRPYDRNLVAANPSFPIPSFLGSPSFLVSPSFLGSRSVLPNLPPPPRSSVAPAPWSPRKSMTESSPSSLPYGSPGVPIPATPYQTLPPPNASPTQRHPFQPSVEADGYQIIRKAIPPALVREVAAFVGKGPPVIARYDTAQLYVTPVEAFRVRDEFVSVCILVLIPIRPIY